MRTGVLPLNALIAFFYIMLASLAHFILKKALQALPKTPASSSSTQQQSHRAGMSYDWLMVLSWAKKYTLIGSCLCSDKKYLLKQFLVMAVFAVTSLGINHIIFWPAGLAAACLPLAFGLLEVLVKKVDQGREDLKAKPNAVNPHPESEVEIESVHIEELVGENVNRVVTNQSAKQSFKRERSLLQIGTICGFCFAGMAMFMQTVMTLGNSVSNSGQLNIVSVLLAVSIDQFAIRPVMGLLVWCTYKLVIVFTGLNPAQLALVQLFCSEEVTSILIEKEKARIRKQTGMTASPPKKKVESPSRVPKAVPQVSEAPTMLNLISLQPTKRRAQTEDEQIEEIYLTTAEKQLFEGKENIQNKSGLQTRRRGCKQNRDVYSLSAAHKGTTVDLNEHHEYDDMMIIKDDPLQQIGGNRLGQFYLEDSRAYNTKRKGYKKKCKRNLVLTGSSPYLQYLPDMLKKVDKFKNDPARKEKRIL